MLLCRNSKTSVKKEVKRVDLNSSVRLLSSFRLHPINWILMCPPLFGGQRLNIGPVFVRCHKCGIIAANLGLTACSLPAEVLPCLPCASAAATVTLRWVGSGRQTGGQVTAFLVGLLDWLFNSLNLLTAELDKCWCWRWPRRGTTSSSCRLAYLPLQNCALTWGRKKPTKGIFFKKGVT